MLQLQQNTKFQKYEKLKKKILLQTYLDLHMYPTVVVPR